MNAISLETTSKLVAAPFVNICCFMTYHIVLRNYLAESASLEFYWSIAFCSQSLYPTNYWEHKSLPQKQYFTPRREGKHDCPHRGLAILTIAKAWKHSLVSLLLCSTVQLSVYIFMKLLMACVYQLSCIFSSLKIFYTVCGIVAVASFGFFLYCCWINFIIGDATGSCVITDSNFGWLRNKIDVDFMIHWISKCQTHITLNLVSNVQV